MADLSDINTDRDSAEMIKYGIAVEVGESQAESVERMLTGVDKSRDEAGEPVNFIQPAGSTCAKR